MLDYAAQPLSGTDVVSFTVGVIAVMQDIIWYPDQGTRSLNHAE